MRIIAGSIFLSVFSLCCWAQAPGTPGSGAIMMGGQKLTAQDVQRLEETVRSYPEDIDSRISLLQHYTQEKNATARLPHVLWMIEHHPEMNVMHSSLAMLTPGSPLASRDDYERGKSLWLMNLRARGDDSRIVVNAAAFLDPSIDLPLILDTLKRGHQKEPANREISMALARIYGRGLAGGSAASDAPFQAEAQLFRNDLAASDDALMLNQVGIQLMAKAGNTDSPERRMGAELRARAKNLDPKLAEETPIPSQIRVGGNVQAYKIKNKVNPEYPAVAKEARIQGTVRFNVLIGKEGDITQMTLVNGHPLLVPSAQQALRQWTYQPTLLNGQPVEVATTVDINFTLSE